MYVLDENHIRIMPNIDQETQTNNNNNTRQRNNLEQEFGCAFTFGRYCIPELLWWFSKEDRPSQTRSDNNNNNNNNNNNQQKNCNEDIPKLIRINNKRII